ncbi:MAG TPA: hypothetical protein VGD21_06500 [Lysobacter sp.]
MSLTFGLTGMDPATETALKAAFAEANSRLGGRWQLVPENEANHVVVDMDSMYGPMSWLRLHGAGKTVIGLTSAPRTQTDFRLNRPFNSDSLVALLREIAPAAEVPAAAPAAPPTTVATPAPPHGLTPAPAPQDQLPEEQPRAPNEEIAAPDKPVSAAVAATLDTPVAPPLRSPQPPSAAPPAASVAAPAPVFPAPPPAPPAAPAPAASPSHRTLADWLAPGQLRGYVRLQRNGTAVLIDVDQRQYYGPAALKPLTGHVEDPIGTGDFAPVDAATWSRETVALGQPQSLTRLLWFGALLAGKGQLARGFDPGARYRLLKWPQTEREFPKHFRIATAMMKGPATLDEIAASSGVSAAEVADFVNASLATGFAEPWREPEPEPEPQKSSGLFGRLRGR